MRTFGIVIKWLLPEDERFHACWLQSNLLARVNSLCRGLIVTIVTLRLCSYNDDWLPGFQMTTNESPTMWPADQSEAGIQTLQSLCIQFILVCWGWQAQAGFTGSQAVWWQGACHRSGWDRTKAARPGLQSKPVKIHGECGWVIGRREDSRCHMHSDS